MGMEGGALQGRVAWITGAGRGIGSAVAAAAAARGMRVVLTARRREEIERVAKGIAAAGGEALAVAADVGSAEQVAVAADAVRERFGRLDLLVVNAGIAIFRTIEKTSPEEWDALLRTNLTGAYLTIRSALPLFTPEGGDIVTMVSVAGRRPFPENGAYCASKYGLLGLTEVLRGELRPRRIRVTALIPGATDTPLWDAVEGKKLDRSRMMRPEAVAEMVFAGVLADRSSAVEWIQMQPSGGSL